MGTRQAPDFINAILLHGAAARPSPRNRLVPGPWPTGHVSSAVRSRACSATRRTEAAVTGPSTSRRKLRRGSDSGEA
ncbi:hypothetical protein Scel_41340 [Streptomyces cellostaticus]|nr:hypothetical protein Scel_41340 [Streptomyces cellostaticus]